MPRSTTAALASRCPSSANYTFGIGAQNIHYLHGALHLFDAGVTIKKFTWVNTGVRLIDQIRDALRDNLYPLIVAEGSSSQKLERIQHSNYLSRSYRSFASIAGVLVIYGHSLGPSDEHIARLIQFSGIRYLYFSLHGDPLSPTNQRIIDTLLAIHNARPQRKPIDVSFFDSSTAAVWMEA